jgi:hypothetical protein
MVSLHSPMQTYSLLHVLPNCMLDVVARLLCCIKTMQVVAGYPDASTVYLCPLQSVGYLRTWSGMLASMGMVRPMVRRRLWRLC